VHDMGSPSSTVIIGVPKTEGGGYNGIDGVGNKKSV